MVRTKQGVKPTGEEAAEGCNEGEVDSTTPTSTEEATSNGKFLTHCGIFLSYFAILKKEKKIACFNAVNCLKR